MPPTLAVSGDGLMPTDATARGFTFTRTVAVLPSTLSRTSADPSAMPVTEGTPPLNVTTEGAVDVHCTECVPRVRSTGLPSLSMTR